MINEKDSAILHLPFFTKEECEECIEYAHKKENELKLKPLNISEAQKYVYGEKRITTLHHNDYNFLIDNKKYIKKFKKLIHSVFENKIKYPVFVQSWINIYRENEEIKWHQHKIVSEISCKSFTANIFLSGDESVGLTYAVHDENFPRYRYKKIKNKLGYIMIMPYDLYHMTKNTSKKERYTVGLTITEYHSTLLRAFYNDENILLIEPPGTKNLVLYQ